MSPTREASPARPARLRVAFVGDDFTGSTDALESLARAGLRSVLFCDAPRPSDLARFPNAEAIGVATRARSMTPDEMDATLPELFRSLAGLRPDVLHYKVCSTFDSSPSIGSIGRALELLRDAVPARTIPIVVGVPSLGRFTAFGHLFARAGSDGEVFRIDRHPTMSRHPVTPMTESDLRRHLALQTDASIGLLDVRAMAMSSSDQAARFDSIAGERSAALLIDVLEPRHLRVAGELIEREIRQAGATVPVVGSSGVGYALVEHWRSAGLLPSPPLWPVLAAGAPVVVVSGSCSPVTAEQTRRAVAAGFDDVALDPLALAASGTDYLPNVAAAVVAAVRKGRSVVMHSREGASDPRLPASGASGGTRPSGAVIGSALARLARTVLEQAPVGRIVVSGGDTSSLVGHALGVDALEVVTPVGSGAPLCRAHAWRSHGVVDGRELMFKGGQTGAPEIYVDVRDGARA